MRSNIHWIIEKAKEFQKNIYFSFIDYIKAFDCMDQNKLWKILKEMWLPDDLTCLLRNLYAGPEATVRTGSGTTEWFKITKGIRQGSIYCYPVYLTDMQCESCKMLGWMNHRLEIKIARRNVDNLGYTDDMTQMAESDKELRRLLMMVREEREKTLKTQCSKTKIMASGPITSW